LPPIETSMTTVSAILPMHVPTQVRWHMRGLINNDGNEAQIVEAFQLTNNTMMAAGAIKLESGITEVEYVMRERLF